MGLLKRYIAKFIRTVITQCKLKNPRIVLHLNLTEMRYFAKSVLTKPFCICLDSVSTTLIGEDCTHLIHVSITHFILLQEKFLQFDWLRAVVLQFNLKYLHVKITNLLGVVV